MRPDQCENKERQLRAALSETTGWLGEHFANPAARQSAAAYLQGLLSNVERKNSWQLAEAAGLATPYRFHHLLSRGAWDADAVGEHHQRALDFPRNPGSHAFSVEVHSPRP